MLLITCCGVVVVPFCYVVGALICCVEVLLMCCVVMLVLCCCCCVVDVLGGYCVVLFMGWDWCVVVLLLRVSFGIELLLCWFVISLLLWW